MKDDTLDQKEPQQDDEARKRIKPIEKQDSDIKQHQREGMDIDDIKYYEKQWMKIISTHGGDNSPTRKSIKG